MMAEHFGINETEYEKLCKIIPLKMQIQQIPCFTVGGGMAGGAFTSWNLLYYIDRHGTKWLRSEIGGTPADRIARAMYKSLSLSGKMEVLKYAEGHEDGWPEESEEENNTEDEEEDG